MPTRVLPPVEQQSARVMMHRSHTAVLVRTPRLCLGKKRRYKEVIYGTLPGCGLVLTLALLGASAEAQTITQVMAGLDSPRGLAFGPEGGLYVTETGVTTKSGNCVAVALGMTCYSETGKVTRLYQSKQERVAEGLPSTFNTVRQDVVGPNDISFQGRGGAYVTIGWGGAPAARPRAIASLVGTLIVPQPSGRWRFDANISDFEEANNPAGGPKHSNPYGVLALPSERYVTDAVQRLGVEALNASDRYRLAGL